MAVLPEEFPVVLTIFLAMGTFRLARVKVLTRRNQTIETLGSATVISTDKTGTLTENRMQLRSLCINGQFADCSIRDQPIPESHHLLIETALLASQPDPFDPMERELFAVGRTHAADHVHDTWRLEKQYPLTRELLAMSCVWTAADDRKEFVVATKGAPEAVMDLCHLGSGQAAAIRRDINAMAATLSVAWFELYKAIGRYRHRTRKMAAKAPPQRINSPRNASRKQNRKRRRQR